MSKFVVVIFPSESVAYEGTRTIKELHAEGTLTLYGLAVLVQETTGKVAIKQAADEGPWGVAAGMLTGALVGLIGGPVGSALGMSAGAMIGGFGDILNLGIRSDFLETVTSKLKPGKAAVVAEIDEGWMAPLDTRMEGLGGDVIRQWRSDFEDEQLDKEVKEEQAELAALKDELKQANANSKNAVKKRLEEARAKLEAAGKRVEARQHQLEQEIGAKRKELESQLSRSQAEAKAGIEKRLAAMQVEHKRRTALLKQAWSLTKGALAA
jgi:uncharacterized membrane protein